MPHSDRQPADLAVVGARIRTLDPNRPWASALAVRDGEIVAVGDDADVRRELGSRTEVVDGRGMCVVPGLVDAHVHPVWGADLSVGVDLTACRDLDDVLSALRAHAARLGQDEWVRGWNLGYHVFAGQPIDAAPIEAAVGGRPTLLLCYDLHTAVATRAALELAGIDGPRDFGDASEVLTRAGVPTGELREPSAYRPVLAVAEAPGAPPRIERAATVLATFASYGLTGGHVMDGSADTLELLASLESAGRLCQRLVVALWQQPQVTDADVERAIASRGSGGRRWRTGMVKLFVDGVVETGTAWLEHPDCCGGGRTSFWSDPDRYREVVGRFAAAGFQCASHAIGDRAVRAALDAYAAAADGSTAVGPHRVEHLEVLADDDLRRFFDGEVVASMQPVYLQYRNAAGTDPWSTRLTAEQAARGFRTGELLAQGGVVALGSDWPVAPADPRLGMAWARLRRPPGQPDAAVLEPSQRLTGLQALHGYTSAAAVAAGDGRLGRIAHGYAADLTAFAADPVTTDADDLVDLPVRLTVVDGEVVHHSD